MFVYECKSPSNTSSSGTSPVTDDTSSDTLSYEITRIRDMLRDMLHTDDPLTYIYPIDDILGETNDTDISSLPMKELASFKADKIITIPNLNSKKQVREIDMMCTTYDRVVLVKPRLSNPIDDIVYLLLFNGSKGKKPSSSMLPTNAGGVIDFMYCMYYYALYIVRLALSVATNSNLTRVRNVNMNVDREYKQYIKSLVDKLQELGIEI